MQDTLIHGMLPWRLLQPGTIRPIRDNAMLRRTPWTAAAAVASHEAP